MTIRYDLAMHSLYAGQPYGCLDQTYEGINWFGEEKDKPSKKKLEAEWKKIEADVLKQERNQSRQRLYPTTEELLVALWEQSVEIDGVTSEAIEDIQARRLAVKKEIP